MALDSVRTLSPVLQQALASAAATPASPSVEARVAEIVAEGLARLTAPRVGLDMLVRTPLPLPVGASVVIERPEAQIGETTRLAVTPALAGGRGATTPGLGTTRLIATVVATNTAIDGAAKPPVATAPPGPDPAPPRGPIFHALAESLPRQAGLAPVVAQAAGIARAPSGTFPTAVTEAARAIVATALSGERPVTPGALAKAIAASGIAAERDGEALILQPPVANAGIPMSPATAAPTGATQLDLKTALQLLRSVLGGTGPTLEVGDATSDGGARPPPPRRGERPVAEVSRQILAPAPLPPEAAATLGALARAAEGAVARIRLAQLASLSPETARGEGRADPAAPAQLHLELPVLFADRASTLSAVVERGARPPHAVDPSSPAWTFTFAVDLGEAGGLSGRVALQRDGRIGVVLRAEKDTALKALRADLEQMREAFRGAGLTLSELDISLGRRLPGRDQPSHFVDTRA